MEKIIYSGKIAELSFRCRDELFLQNIVERDIQILILESSEHPILEWECRHIVDCRFLHFVLV